MFKRHGAFLTTPGKSPKDDVIQQWLADPTRSFPYGTAEQLSLVCDDCYPLPTAAECLHNLDLVPPWKRVPQLLYDIKAARNPAERENLRRELLGFSDHRLGAVYDMETIQMVSVVCVTKRDYAALHFTRSRFRFARRPM